MSGLSLIADEISALLDPVIKGLEAPESLQSLLNEIGVVDSTNANLLSALTTIGNFAQQCETFATQGQPSFQSASALLDLSRKAFSALSVLKDTSVVTSGLASLGEDLAEFLVGVWLANRHPRAYSLGLLLSLIEGSWDQQSTPAQRDASGNVSRYGFQIDRLHPERIVDLIRDPVGALKSEYGHALATNADADALAAKLFPRLKILLRQFGVICSFGIDPADAVALNEWAAPLNRTFILYLQHVATGDPADAGVIFTFSPTSFGGLGLVVAPFGSLNITTKAGPWSVNAQVGASVDAITWGPSGPSVFSASNSSLAELSASVTSTLAAPASGPAVVFGSPTGTRLEIGGATLSANAHIASTASTVGISAAVSKSTLVIAGGDSDGFVSTILPSGGLKANFNLGIGWSNDKGLTLSGGGGMAATLPVGLSIGGVTFSTIHLALTALDGALNGELSANLSTTIGPIQASVERLGLSTAVTFPSSGGNLGFADIAFGLKGPTGVGLAIDAHGVLSGGGFLSSDPATGNYGGVLQLSLHDTITLTGYGLLATKMPDGSSGFSLLVFITADGFEPIPLGLGFVLQSIGGMLGINRTFDLDVVRSGLKSDSLKQLLFPRDPVANAPALLQALATTFPVRSGSYLVGLLARITWFTPTLVTFDLALILELGNRTRLLALGRVSALLPSADNDLIRLNMDTDGVLDFDASSFEADAALFDSRLVHQFPITGSAALRARWGSNSTFVLAIGGLNPHFAPPSGFPSLTRVSIALSSGNNPRLICDAYLAITSNTLQFGAHVDLHAEAAGVSVDGDLGFDALISLRPPHFIIDFHASVHLKYHSFNLFSVTLDGTLEGPLPLHLSARASISILFFSISAHFDFTLADGRSGTAPPSVLLEDQVKAALIDPANWTTLNAAAPAHGVSLRSLPSKGVPILDPLGQLMVQQQIAPLNADRPINVYDGVAVSGPQRFDFAATFDGQAGAPVTAQFAPARYFKMSDDDKIAAPSFENRQSGVTLGDNKIKFDTATFAPAPLQYDEYVLGPQGGTTQSGIGRPPPVTPDAAPKAVAASTGPTGTYQMTAADLAAQTATGAAGRAPTRTVGRARFQNLGAAKGAVAKPQNWVMVNALGAPKPAAASPPPPAPPPPPRPLTPPPPSAGPPPPPAPPPPPPASPSPPAPPSTPVDVWSDGKAKLASSSWAVVPAYEVQ